jgi:hypothetical protein
MMSADSFRRLLVGWMYLIALGHFMGALAMTWLIDLPLFADYHHTVLAAFDLTSNRAEVFALHKWWMALFGVTLQAFALFLLALVYYANRFRQAAIWLWLAVVILIWAPQDILISIQQGVWLHLWVDLAAVGAMVPPLVSLWWLDRKNKQE